MLVNIDVPDLEAAREFYCRALGLTVSRRFDGWLELAGASAPIYLLPKDPATPISPASTETRDYRRHWTPVHLDFVVSDLEAAVQRARAAGASVESGVQSHAWGSIALLGDPFGNGFCLLQFTGRGYDEVVQ